MPCLQYCRPLARFWSGSCSFADSTCHLQNPGAAVGETEWHRSDGGAHNTHFMREGSSANNYGNVMMTNTNRQPLSEENALAMQRQEESLLAAQMSHAHLTEDQKPQNDDVGRTDSMRGVRGAMAPKHASAASVVGALSWPLLCTPKPLVLSGNCPQSSQGFLSI